MVAVSVWCEHSSRELHSGRQLQLNLCQFCGWLQVPALARRQHWAVKNARTNIIKHNPLNDTFQVAEISLLQKLELCEPKVDKGKGKGQYQNFNT